jgi:threonine-phosphate decarboxylase
MKRIHGGKRLAHPDDVLDFSTNVNRFGPPEGVRRLFAGDLAEDIASYPDPDYPDLKQALCEYTGRGPDEIFLSNGSVEVFYWINYLLRPERILVVSPSFCEYILSGQSAGAEIIEHFLVPEEGFTLGIKQVLRRAGNADLVILANPNSPTGNLFSRDALLELASSLKPGATLLVDEAFMDFCEKKDEHALLSHINDKIWVSRSLTKFFSLAGLRIGYFVAPSEVVAKLEEKTPPWRVNRFAEMASLAALSDGEFISSIPGRTAAARERFTKSLESTNNLKPFPAAANFILVAVEHDFLDAPRLKDLLFPRGFLIRDASSFSGLSEKFIRLCVRKEEENAALVEELKVLLSRGESS